MISSIVTRIKPVIVAVIAAGCLGTVAMPFMASAGQAAAATAAISAPSSAASHGDTPWP